MQQFILEFIGEYGSFAVFLLILIENLLSLIHISEPTRP